MNKTFDTVDLKVAESEFFLRKMAECKFNFAELGFYFSAFLSAARTITLALQQFQHLDGFKEWYAPHQETLKSNPVAKFFLETRNDHLHGGIYPVTGGSSREGKITFHFRNYEHNKQELGDDDVLDRCRNFFICLLEIVFDCYLKLGPQINPQQHYTAEHFKALGRTVGDAELELFGWTMDSSKEQICDESDRWRLVRSHVGDCQINHLFHGYLRKVTPQPAEPEDYQDFTPTNEDRGWVHIPAGFKTIDEWLAYIGKTRKREDDLNSP